MSYPTPVLLPNNAKYVGFVDATNDYNPHWDIVWSFKYALVGTQHAFCTFLTTNNSLSSGIPGQYLGYLGDYPYRYDSNGSMLISGNHIPLLSGPPSLSSKEINGILAIAFDSTGYFALSNSNNSGVGRGSIAPKSLIVRCGSRVVVNQTLNSLNPDFKLANPVPVFKTIRIKLTNGGKKLYVDYSLDDSTFSSILETTIEGLSVTDYSNIYPAFTFCSPVSSASITPSVFQLKNFHTQGNINGPTYETVNYTPINDYKTGYTTLTGISATKI